MWAYLQPKLRVLAAKILQKSSVGFLNGWRNSCVNCKFWLQRSCKKYSSIFSFTQGCLEFEMYPKSAMSAIRTVGWIFPSTKVLRKDAYCAQGYWVYEKPLSCFPICITWHCAGVSVYLLWSRMLFSERSQAPSKKSPHTPWHDRSFWCECKHLHITVPVLCQAWKTYIIMTLVRGEAEEDAKKRKRGNKRNILVWHTG